MLCNVNTIIFQDRQAAMTDEQHTSSHTSARRGLEVKILHDLLHSRLESRLKYMYIHLKQQKSVNKSLLFNISYFTYVLRVFVQCVT